MEAMEPRLLFSAAGVEAIWTIHGDVDPANPADEIIIQRSADDPARIEARVNGEVVDSRLADEIAGIDVFAGNGDDMVRVKPGGTPLGVPIRLYGGNGDDALIGGPDDEVLFGGDGNDLLMGYGGDDPLHGGNGEDLLDGGDGIDTLHGGRGVDWLFGPADVDAVSPDSRDVHMDPESVPLVPIDSLARLRQWVTRQAFDDYGHLFGTMHGGWSWPHYTGVIMTGDVQLGIVSGLLLFSDLATTVTVASADFSGTNVQIEGIDEADLVKTDGRYLYVLSDGELAIIDADPSGGLVLLSRTGFEDDPQEMYLHGDRLTLISRSQVSVLDVSDRSAPQLLERTSVDGWIVDSRAIDGRVVIVVKNDFEVAPRRLSGHGYETEGAFYQRMGDSPCKST